MDLMSDAAEWCWLLVVHEYKAMPNFWIWMAASHLAESSALISQSGQKVMAFVVMKPHHMPPDP
jgi:hypothetical protein